MKIAQYLKKTQCTQRDFARLIGVSPATVCQWISGQKMVSPKRARLIEKETGGVLTRLDLRPDIFAA